jgi:glycosyltransferase involved in cell wall biosynthesis
MARILLDARNITDTPAGVARYAMQLIPELIRLAPHHHFVALRHTSNRKTLGVEGLDEVYVSTPIHNLINYLLGPTTLRSVFEQCGEPDLYHNLFHILPRNVRREIKVVVTLHDLIWIDHARESQDSLTQAWAVKTFASFAIPRALDRADHVICVSEPTRDRALNWLETTPSTVIPHGVGERFFRPPPSPTPLIAKWQKEGAKFAVAIGNAKPYKNLTRVIEAFAEVSEHIDNCHLVLIGNCEGLRPHIERTDMSPRVHLVGFLDDPDLRSFLGHARLFVFPSTVEGFGLPILEAMAMGTPTLVSDREPMRSVAGDAAVRIDPFAVSPMAQEIRDIFENDQRAGRLSEEGKAHASKFLWETTARKTLAVYETTLAAQKNR